MTEKGEENYPQTLVIIAALNEEEGIGPTLTEIKDCLNNPLCLVVDGHSIDDTVKVAKTMGAQVILQKGSGKGDAIATAIKHAGALGIKHVAFIDADFTYPAEYLPEMIRILRENPGVGMVCGNRFNTHLHLGKMHNILYLGNRMIAFIHNFLNSVQMHDPLTGLRVVRWDIIKDWKPKSKSFDIEVELNHHVERKGRRIIELPIHYRSRLGEKKLKVKHGFGILRRIVLESI